MKKHLYLKIIILFSCAEINGQDYSIVSDINGGAGKVFNSDNKPELIHQDKNVIHSAELRIDSQIENKLYREGSLPQILAYISNDENLQLERLAAYHFHQLINEYRASKGKKTLYWDDRLWLAARNHNISMISGNNFSHSEKSDQPHFSGRYPEDRVTYVTYGLKEIKGMGENIVMSYAEESDNLDEYALEIAAEAFEIWKNSSGHNRNMLEPKYFAHGTALNVSGEEQFFGTSVFSFHQPYFNKNEITINWNDVLKEKQKKQITEDGLTFSEKEWKVEIDKLKLKNILHEQVKANDDIKLLKSADKAAKMHLIYLLEEKQTGTSEEKRSDYYYGSTPTKRWLRSSNYLGLFRLLFSKVVEITFSLDLTEEQLRNKSALLLFEEKLEKEYLVSKDVKFWGGTVELMENGENYRCVFDVLYLQKN